MSDLHEQLIHKSLQIILKKTTILIEIIIDFCITNHNMVISARFTMFNTSINTL